MSAQVSLVNNTTQRIRSALQRHGPAGSAYRAARWLIRRVFFNRHVVFVHPGLPGEVAASCLLRTSSFESYSTVPECVYDELEANLDSRFREVALQEFAAHGRLWIGFLDGRVAAFQWSRSGAHISKWFVPLAPGDVVIFNTVTKADCRGRGIAPAIMAEIIRNVRYAGGRVYIDCKVWNQPAIRSVCKVGFHKLAVSRPLR